MLIIGVDPGKNGGIAILRSNGEVCIAVKMPATDRDCFDFLMDYPMAGSFAMIEQVHSSPQMGVASSFTFGRGYGFLQGLLIASGIAFDFVSPQRWQKAMGCLTKGDKNVSKQKAQQLFPSQKISHATADALLIAEFGRLYRRPVSVGEKN